MISQLSASVLNILDFGACGDGTQLDTIAIQNAIEAASQSGATVFFPSGTYRTGTIFLRSNITLDISGGASIKGSSDINDYPAAGRNVNPDAHKDLQTHHLIIAEDVSGITVCGAGMIDGSGPAFWDPPSSCDFFTEKDARPSAMIHLSGCRNMRFYGITIFDSPGWTIHLHECSDTVFSGVTVENNLLGPNTDGFDINDSRDIRISDCHISTGDDAIVLKSLGGVCERITITNCVCRTNCSGLKLGANESLGTIRQVTMSNCIVYDSLRGISLYCMGGGLFEDVTFSNIICENNTNVKLACPLHINLSRNPNKKRDRGVGRIRNIRMSDILVKSDARILLTAEAGHMLENIFLHNIHMEYPAVENEFEWARRAVGLQFSPFNPDARGAEAVIVAENIKNLVVQNVTTEWPQDPQAKLSVLWARNVQRGLIDCPIAQPTPGNDKRYDIENCENLIVRG